MRRRRRYVRGAFGSAFETLVLGGDGLADRATDEGPDQSTEPFVRLFFECVALTGGKGLHDPWLHVASDVTDKLGLVIDQTELRLGVALTRGLLIDVLAAAAAALEATKSLERFDEIWNI